MTLTVADIEKPRSPGALRRFVLAHAEAVRADLQERRLGLLKKGLYKEFLDEIVPLSCFSVLAYPEDVQVLPILGNQAYDAVVLDALGHEIDRIEVTAPRDGAAEAADARRVTERGVGSIRVGEPGDDFEALFEHALRTCRSKARKDYEDCTLVVAIEPMPPFSGLEGRFEEQICRLVANMRQITFMASRVFLLVLPDRLVRVSGQASEGVLGGVSGTSVGGIK
jgi:hypothetical protein